MNNILDSFVNKKKAEAEFLSIKDGESVRIKKFKELKAIQKPNFVGELTDALRFTFEVEMDGVSRIKKWDNGTQKFAQEVMEKGLTIGDGFTLTRKGTAAKTNYIISDITKEEDVK